MGNLYGVAGQPPLAVVAACIGAADVAVASGTETNVIASGALAAAFPGNYYPVMTGLLAVLLGATAPTGLTVAFRIGAGSDVDSYTVATALLVNAATIQIPICLVGASSGTAWIGAGSTLNVTLNPVAQAVTAKFVGSRCLFQLLRAPD